MVALPLDDFSALDEPEDFSALEEPDDFSALAEAVEAVGESLADDFLRESVA